MQVAIYARVSTKDGRQDTENQLVELRGYAGRAGWTIYREYVDNESGKTGERDEFKRLFADAAQRRFGVVLVWALDRFTRQGVLETFQFIEQLRRNDVQFESFTEPHFRTTGPAGELMLAVAAWIAKQERIRISDRTKAGLETAKRKGKVLGRPKVVTDRQAVREMRAAGKSWSELAHEAGLSRSTIRRICAQQEKQATPACLQFR